MRPFEPEQLRAAREKVVESHPDTVDRLQTGDSSQKSWIADSILEKIRTYDGSNADEVVSKLTEVERDYLPSLLIDYEGDDLRAALVCIELLSVQIPFEDAWYLVNHHFDTGIGRTTAANSELPKRGRASAPSAEVMRIYRRHSADRALAEIFRTAIETSAPSAVDDLKSALDIADGGELAQAVDERVLTVPSRSLWLAQTPTYMTEVFRRLDLSRKVEALDALRRGFSEASMEEIVTCEQLEGIFRWIVEHKQIILPELEERRSALGNWYRALLNLLDFDDFFEEDHERYDFWKQYTDKVDNLHADLEKGRLFLDFGEFGVIEFKETGNATYVYEKSYFQKMQELHQVSGNIDHGKLKNKNHAIAHLSHYSGWQEKFHRRLQRLLNEHGSSSDETMSTQGRPSNRASDRPYEAGISENEEVERDPLESIHSEQHGSSSEFETPSEGLDSDLQHWFDRGLESTRKTFLRLISARISFLSPSSSNQSICESRESKGETADEGKRFEQSGSKHPDWSSGPNDFEKNSKALDRDRLRDSSELKNVGKTWSSKLEGALYFKAKRGTDLLTLQDQFGRHVESIRKKIIQLKRNKEEYFNDELCHVFEVAAYLDCSTRKWKAAERKLLKRGISKGLSPGQIILQIGRREDDIRAEASTFADDPEIDLKSWL
jgi:hypothetical protein